jgi:hypothetical protein
VPQWTDTEVARHWLRLCPIRKETTGQPAEPTEAELDTIRCRPEKKALVRRRLSDISWLMRMIAEPIARMANHESRVGGRSWQGRFKSVRLCDEAALLACLAFVDLNSIRTGLAATPESSDCTSIQRRLKALDSRVVARTHAGSPASRPDTSRPDAWLTPIPLAEAEADPPARWSASRATAPATKVAGRWCWRTIWSWSTGPAGRS